MNRDDFERFFSRVERNHVTGCWLWLGKLRLGYGMTRVTSCEIGAHRYSYEMFVGPILHGLHIDHLCRHPRCVNPAHLEVVLPEDNRRRANARPVTRCVSGHVRTPENTQMRRSRNGLLVPYCRDCMREGRSKDRAKTWDQRYRTYLTESQERRMALSQARAFARRTA